MTLQDQTCPTCHITEAKSTYCTRCLARTQPDWLHLPKRSAAQDAALRVRNAGRPKESGLGEPERVTDGAREAA